MILKLPVKPIAFPIDPTFSHLNPDFHNTDDCAEIMRTLGLICIDWNFCEHLFSTLLWEYVGGHEVGMIITSPLGNQTQADILLGISRKFEKSKRLLECINFASVSFNKLREIRNILLHSHTVMLHSTETKLAWTRMSNKGQSISINITPEDFNEIYHAIGNLVIYMISIQVFFARRKQGKRSILPKIFSVPIIPVPLRSPNRRSSHRKRQTARSAKR